MSSPPRAVPTIRTNINNVSGLPFTFRVLSMCALPHQRRNEAAASHALVDRPRRCPGSECAPTAWASTSPSSGCYIDPKPFDPRV